MTVGGSIYGVVLNDRAERDGLQAQFAQKPYEAPPQAPVVYMKARPCVAHGSARLPEGQSVRAAATLALLFARDACRVDAANALACVGGVALALDLSLPQENYYRPAIAQSNRDGFLQLGAFVAPVWPDEIVTRIDGVEAHRWRLDRLVRPAADLVAALSGFMTLRAGDVLLVGLPGDAPMIGAGQAALVEAADLPSLAVRMEAETAA